MEAVVDYIMSNYTWFLGGLIIILLAVIGYYADKTKFGQGSSTKQDSDDLINFNSDLENKKINDLVKNVDLNQPEVIEEKQNFDENKTEESQLIEENLTEIEQNPQEDFCDSEEQPKEETINLDENSVEVLDPFDNQFDDFDKEFNELLPEKSIVDENMLDDIDDISFDKTQKLTFDNEIDLSELDLPKIKSFELDDKDIWKF